MEALEAEAFESRLKEIESIKCLVLAKKRSSKYVKYFYIRGTNVFFELYEKVQEPSYNNVPYKIAYIFNINWFIQTKIEKPKIKNVSKYKTQYIYHKKYLLKMFLI